MDKKEFMSRRVYIQSDDEKLLPNHFDCASALYGAIDSCMDYKLVLIDEVISGKFDALIKKHVFIGSTQFMKEVFKRVGLTDVRLPMNSIYPCETITLEEFYERVADGNTQLFIKPVEIKLFTGFVYEGFQYSILKNLPPTTQVMVYKPFDPKLESEWRVYVKDTKIIDWKNYSGAFDIMPDYNYVRSIIAEFKHILPSAYTIDVGILANKENVVIEFNDMWAIGNYGLSNDVYLELLSRRYFEIMNSI